MSWSLGETGALALKAARGAGMTWGLAEEASEAVVWLQARGLPGVSALCRYLSWYQLQNGQEYYTKITLFHIVLLPLERPFLTGRSKFQQV